MSIAELLPVVRSLSHPDKLRLLQFLAGELARNVGLPSIQPGAEFPIWSPFDAFDAAATLGKTLGDQGGRS
jgi:hypothetical protein